MSLPRTAAGSRAANLRQAAALWRRAVVGILRQPELIAPSILFPLIMAAISTAAFQRTTSLRGFPTVDSFLDFMVATTILQGAQFGAIGGGIAMARDIEGGFFDRLVSSPVSRWSIVVGRLGGTATLAAFQAVFFMAVMGAFGASVEGGIAGMLTIVLAAVLLAIGIGGFAVAMALRTGSAEAVQAAFPAFFIAFFLSSAFFPRSAMQGWFKVLAGVNPLSWLIEALRDLVIVGFSGSDAIRAVGLGALLAVASVTASRFALRRRLAGTGT